MNKIIQTVIAFANTAGGTIVIGVTDKAKEVVGVQNILKEEERIASAIAASIFPLISPNFQFHTWRDRDLLIISVAYMPKPYYLKNKGLELGVYIRLGSTNRIADGSAIAEIQRLSVHESYDAIPNLKTTQNDLDFELAKDLFLKVGKKFEANSAKSLGLITHHQSYDYPSNGAVLLFGKNRNQFFLMRLYGVDVFQE